MTRRASAGQPAWVPTLVLALVVVMSVVVVLAVGSPWWAVRQLHEAAQAAPAEQPQRLNRLVDWPALRGQLKHSVQDSLAHRALNAEGQPTQAASWGAEVAAALLGPIVDERVTPESLCRLLRGQAATDDPPGSATGTVPQTEAGYESPNRFVLSIRRQPETADPAWPEEAVRLVLHRRGLFGWKLAELRLP